MWWWRATPDEGWKRCLFINYNLATLEALGRSEDTSHQFSSADVVSLTRTGVFWNRQSVTRENSREHIVFSLGFARTPFSNKACGVQIRSKKVAFAHAHVLDVLARPPGRMRSLGVAAPLAMAASPYYTYTDHFVVG